MRELAEQRRLASAAGAAVLLHVGIAAALMTRAPDTLPARSPEISVNLIIDTPKVEPQSVEEVKPVKEPPVGMTDIPEPTPTKTEPITPAPDPAVMAIPPASEPSPNPRAEPSVDIDPRWSLSPQPEPEVIAPTVSGLSSDLACINSTDPACEDVRIELYAEHMLSESDKVWMPSFAHSGLSDARFRGMDEAQIRAELGIPTAGANGFYLPFSSVGISSYWLDPLYGVNKRCKMVVGKRKATEDYAGQTVVGQDCGEMRGALGDQPLWRKEWKPGGYDRPRPDAWMLKE